MDSVQTQATTIRKLNRLKRGILLELHSPMLHGFIRRVRTKCGKSGCKCTKGTRYWHSRRQHGRYEVGRLRFTSITKDQEILARDAIGRYRRLKLLLRDLAGAWSPLFFSKNTPRSTGAKKMSAKDPQPADRSAMEDVIASIVKHADVGVLP